MTLAYTWIVVLSKEIAEITAIVFVYISRAQAYR